MRCFEVVNGSVYEGLLVRQHPDGWHYTPLGEPGRGRHLARVAIVGVPENTDRIYSASLTKNFAGRTVLSAEDDGRNDVVLVRLHPTHGFRGKGRVQGPRTLYKCDFHSGPEPRLIEIVLPDWKHDFKDIPTCSCGGTAYPHRAPLDSRIQVVAVGMFADGDAGRMADSEDVLAVLPKGVPVVLQRSGRLYGSPARYLVWYDGEQVHSEAILELARYPELPKGLVLSYQHPIVERIQLVLDKLARLDEEEAYRLKSTIVCDLKFALEAVDPVGYFDNHIRPKLKD